VWKCIRALKNDGFNIEAVTNKGYRLISCEDILCGDVINSYLDNNLRDRLNIAAVSSVTSTNRLVKDKAVQGENEGYVLISGHQTEGRGRLGRSFYSPSDSGVYMSILLKPSINPQDATLITTAAAVSVCEALCKMGVTDTGIKWVNDIFIGDRKVCGILTEAGFDIENNLLSYAVLGVGLNMYAPEGGFPEDIKDIAGAVFSEKREDARNKFVSAFLTAFFRYYEDIESRSHISSYRDKCFVLGKEINIIKGDTVTRARALDVDDNCGLVVELSDGEKAVVSSGEISIRTIK
jgi:BirA family biotin operon repressor/biotin-[acetyl-CoA-carboxylase] ligase